MAGFGCGDGVVIVDDVDGVVMFAAGLDKVVMGLQCVLKQWFCCLAL